MTYEVLLRPAARRALGRLPPQVSVAVLALLYGDLREEPRRVGTPLGPPLTGQYSARRGEYRVRSRIDTDTVTVLDVAHRRDAYRS